MERMERKMDLLNLFERGTEKLTDNEFEYLRNQNTNMLEIKQFITECVNEFYYKESKLRDIYNKLKSLDILGLCWIQGTPDEDVKNWTSFNACVLPNYDCLNDEYNLIDQEELSSLFLGTEDILYSYVKLLWSNSSLSVEDLITCIEQFMKDKGEEI